MIQRSFCRLASLAGLALILGLVASCGPMSRDASSQATGSPYLLVFAGDRDGRDSDFVAVIDVDPKSPSRGKVINTQPVGLRMSMPHHMDYVLPPKGEPVFMNAHDFEETLIVDVSNPRKPAITGSFGAPSPLRFPHDYARTERGTRLVGFLRSDGASPDPSEKTKPAGHGGIGEYSMKGELIRTVSAAVPGLTKPMRAYAFALLPKVDRFVVTSAPMMEQSWADVIQIYRYSDFKLLHTMTLPPAADRLGRIIAGSQAAGFGPRVLADGSVFFNSYGCAFYHLSAIDSTKPQLKAVHALETERPSRRSEIRGACGIPLNIGRYWLQPVGTQHKVIVLDIANPDQPRIVHRLSLPADFKPHWLARDPTSDRVVLGAELGSERGFYMLRFDASSGRLTFDDRFNGRRDNSPLGFLKSGRRGYISLEQESWPHGRSGAAWGHAALFMPHSDEIAPEISGLSASRQTVRQSQALRVPAALWQSQASPRLCGRSP
jgi:hypothetical protein